jgi:hypothetical protein
LATFEALASTDKAAARNPLTEIVVAETMTDRTVRETKIIIEIFPHVNIGA